MSAQHEYTDGNEQVISFSGIAWYYGDNDFILQLHCTFRHSARDSVSDTGSHVTYSKNTGFYKLCAAARFPD